MPTDETFLQQAEEFKAAGNASFSNQEVQPAIASYSQGLVACDRLAAPPAQLKASLLSNRAMCYLKVMQLQPCIDDCDTALALSNLQDSMLRSKLLYRRAKSRFLLANAQKDTGAASAGSVNASLQDAAKDLLNLLQLDPTNKEASALLQTIRVQHKMQATAATPVSQTLKAIQEETDDKKRQQSLKRLMGLLDNDLTNAGREMGRCDGVALLLRVTTSSTTTITKTNVLALQCLRTASALPAFARTYLAPVQTDLLKIVEANSQQTESAEINKLQSDIIVTVLALTVRLILHADRDDFNTDIDAVTALDYTTILKIMVVCWDTAGNDNKTVLRATLDVLSTWTAGADRDATIRSALHIAGLSDPTVPVPVSQSEIRAFTPQQLAVYRKRNIDQLTRDEAWAFERARLFCRGDGLKVFLKATVGCEDHVVRREMTVVLGRLLVCLDDDDKIKEAVKEYLFTDDGGKKDEGVIIEEVFNDDDEAKMAVEVVEPLEKLMARAVITAALLLSRKEVGAWALSFGWANSAEDLPIMINSGEPRAMCLVSEVASGAATVESARHLVVNMLGSGEMETLIMNPDRDIRSGAASAVAKLGLSDKASDDGEIMGLLQAACGLLEDDGDEPSPDKNDGKLHHFNSFATSSVERAIEMINYLISNTTVKEEVAEGFQFSPDAQYTALERLVKVADMPNVGESLTGFGLATIFQNMAVTNHQLRKEAFEGKEVTMEAYDEMQKLGKTEEEIEVMNATVDLDTQTLCDERIRKMATANVPRAIIAITEGASEHTLEQLVLALARMACEPAARGNMIQQGVLTACIKIEKNESPTETDAMKKVIRSARHTIAKMLVTTNPSLLTSAQRLGSIKPLIQLIRDNHASDLEIFEALMAITNLASSGEDAKNRIIAEKGISSLHYAMFSVHEMVKRAATEAMCNLVPHKKMMEHLAERDILKLWLAFATEFEENYECARAAAGCLAMSTQDESIAVEIVELERFKSEMTLLLECGRLEIMHRALVVLLNLVLHNGTCRAKVVEEGLVAFCAAYVDSFNKNETNELEFSEEERALLPVTVDIAKTIVSKAEE
jgi:tetratricopeptide (TPR) repeat protein